ncbi:Fungal specific transcription factor domain [Ceratobasidium sp. AG-Ba]|nr:Fungal specific transcription factor domain [Ceratobasidium sp. AG-Ba]QRW04647.1 Fungal specific transcription factor domain [Ceratobasidium sp. AG-Ba]
MSLRYETDDTPEPHENPPGEDDTGLRWMHGIPDLFLVMLAKINMLREDFGTDIHYSIITELQTQVEAFKPVAGTSDDPLMNVMVTIIQESWRQVMFIYIFMGLGGANSADPLVTQPLKRFIKLLNNAKPTRNQDLFLLWPMIIVFSDANAAGSVDPNQWLYNTFGEATDSLLDPSSHDVSLELLGLDASNPILGGQHKIASVDSTYLRQATVASVSGPQNLDGLFADYNDGDSSSSEYSETEDTQTFLYRALTLDRKLSSNTVPFIIDSYARWITRNVLDPIKLVKQNRGFIFRRLERSEATRSVTILKANVLRIFLNSSTSTVDHIPVLSLLTNSVRNSIAAINTRKSLPESNTNDILDAIENIMELIHIHELSNPLSDTIRLIAASAPVYRRARPEPLGQPLNLRLCILHPDIFIRFFPAMDILFSLRTGRPMCMKYTIEDISGPQETPPGDDDTGLHWMYGIPDHFLILLAKINMLREDFGTDVDKSVIDSLRAQVERFNPTLGTSENSLTNIMGTIIQESWRHAIYVLISMGLGGANSADPLVVQPLKRFIKILKNSQPMRKQDLFLMWPMVVVGVAAVRHKDRDLIQRRMLGLKECSQPGTCGFDSVQIMSEIWARSDAEMRPAVWMDLRFAALKVTGI